MTGRQRIWLGLGDGSEFARKIRAQGSRSLASTLRISPNLMAARRKTTPPRRPGMDDLASRALDVLEERGRPVLSAALIARRLGGRRGLSKALRATLRQLERQGRVEQVKGGFRVPRTDGLVEGQVSSKSAVVDDSDVRWHIDDLAEARLGDRVLIQPVGPVTGRRAEIVRLLTSERRSWVGIVQRGKRGYELVSYRDDDVWRIKISARHLGAARVGEVVEAVPVEARGRGPSPGVQVVERLGRPGDAEADVSAVVWHRRLPVAFGAAAIAEAEAATAELTARELGCRLDLRDRCFITIDPATARDHDDALCIEALPGGGARLWVAIADVSHFVPAGSALDREAWLRGNSVYFPTRLIPMLPERLSGDLCSLRPGVDRRVLAAELTLNPDGSTKQCALHAGVIRSRAKLAYEQAARVMDPAEDSSPEEADEPLQDGVADGLALLARFAAKMTEQRLASGALDFELPSPEIVLDADGRAVDIVRASRTVAHRAVEESMLAANRAVARALLGAEEPAIYRVHEAPGQADLESLIELYESFGLLGGDTDGGLSPRSIGRALGRAAGRPEEPLVNLVTLRAMRQARYDEQNLGHYALAFEAYLHFTSPIRRYADLVVHRAVRRLIDPPSAAGPSAAGERRPMQHIAIRTSARERVAMAAERDVLDLTKCSFMAQHVGRELGGTITGVAEHGLYVTLDDFFVEGLIHVRALPGYFDLDASAHALVARRSGQRFALGDRLRVRVERVDQLKARIDFGIVEGSRDPARDGSSAKRADRPGRRARRSGAPTRRRVRR